MAKRESADKAIKDIRRKTQRAREPVPLVATTPEVDKSRQSVFGNAAGKKTSGDILIPASAITSKH